MHPLVLWCSALAFLHQLLLHLGISSAIVALVVFTNKMRRALDLSDVNSDIPLIPRRYHHLYLTSRPIRNQRSLLNISIDSVPRRRP